MAAKDTVKKISSELYEGFSSNFGISGGSLYEICSVLDFDKSEGYLRDRAVSTFTNINPLTYKADVSDSVYASSISLAVMTDVVPPQIHSDGCVYFNPSGCVTVAEFLDSLNAIKNGSNSSRNRKKSLDSISTEEDFFNEGYCSCVDKYSSPLFNTYGRIELFQPITRLELAYITVICWSDFRNKFGSVFSGEYGLGIGLDWCDVGDLLSHFEDGFSYNVCRKSLSDGVLSINIKDYLRGMSMTSYMQSIKQGVLPIAFPMFMCLLECLDLLCFEGYRLDPMKEVTRGELAHFVVELAKII